MIKQYAKLLVLKNHKPRSLQITTATCLFKRKESKKQNKKISVSPSFLENLKLWPKLFDAEVNAGFEKLDELLNSGAKWEIIEERGSSITNLDIIEDYFDAKHGRILILTGKFLYNKWLRPGCPVSLCVIKEDNHLKVLAECYVSSVINNTIRIICNEISFTGRQNSKYLIMPSRNQGSINTLQNLLKNPDLLSSDSIHLVNLAYRSTPMPSIHDRKIKTLCDSFNESQVSAISAALNQKRNLLCIQGPPGTGKTRVIAECVSQLIEKRKRVLVCAATHVAVKNVINATITQLQQKHSQENINNWMTNLSERHDELSDHPGFNKLENMNSQLSKMLKSSVEWERLKNSIHHVKNDFLKDIFKSKRVIFATLTTSFIQKLPLFGWNAEVIIIDEAAQCTEPATWIPVLTTNSCKKLVLVGDQKQLPAVLISETAKKNNLNVSLMEKLAKDFPKSNINILLNEQHRMNKKIIKWSNDVFYDSQLKTHPSVANIKLNDIYPVLKHESSLNLPILMINMDKKKQRSREKSKEKSFVNNDEVEMVCSYVKGLIEAVGVNTKDIAIISPYFSQIEILRNKICFENVDINTVDAFQGQERQIIIFCLVRDNSAGSIGFLEETRRLNVAVTRAKRQFVLIGSAKMMIENKHLSSLYQYLNDEKSVFGPDLLKEFDCLKTKNK